MKLNFDKNKFIKNDDGYIGIWRNPRMLLMGISTMAGCNPQSFH